MNTAAFYENRSTIDTFNTLLGGRWHTGYTPTLGGQLQIEETIANNAQLSKNDLVLDFGSGCGLVTLDYYAMSGAKLVGLTNSHEQTARACALREYRGISSRQVKFIYSDLFEKEGRLPFKNSTFTKIVFTESVCHVRDKAGLFREFYRILTRCGIVCGEDWFTSLVNGYPDIERSYHIPRICRIEDYMSLCRDAGFNMCHTEKIVPSWKTSWYGLLSGLTYKLKYPTILMFYPFSDTPQVNQELVEHGSLLERGTINGTFYIGIITCTKQS